MFKKLFCKHNYKKVATASYFDSSTKSYRPYQITIVYMCSHCGKTRKLKI